MLETKWKWDYHFVMKMDFNYLYLFSELLLSYMIQVHDHRSEARSMNAPQDEVADLRGHVHKEKYVCRPRTVAVCEKTDAMSCAMIKNETFPRSHYKNHLTRSMKCIWNRTGVV